MALRRLKLGRYCLSNASLGVSECHKPKGHMYGILKFYNVPHILKFAEKS